MWVSLAWIERHCVIPDGFRKNQPFKLYEYQVLFLANFYLVKGTAEWHPENPVKAPAFVFRTALLVGPQKIGKNPSSAAQVCLEGVGPALFAGRAGNDEGYVCLEHGCRCGWEYAYAVDEPKGMSWPTPLIQITAFSEDSTGNTYDALRPMIEGGPLADVIPKTGEDFIRLPGGGRIDTVTSSSRSRLGNPITYADEDELGLWTPQTKMTTLHDTQSRNAAGMGGRISGKTNAWDPAEDSVAKRLYQAPVSDIYRQFVRPPANLSYANKAERRKIHQVVYPSDTWRENGGHIDLDSIEAEAAALVERDTAQAARFFGNMLVAGGGAAVDPLVWSSLRSKTLSGPPPAGARIGAGFDGSISRDATFLEGCTAEGYSFTIAKWERPANAKPDWKVDRDQVRDAIDRMFGTWDVGLFMCDPPKWWTEIGDWERAFGEDVVIRLDTNQATKFAPAVDRWRTGIAEGKYTHDGDPAGTAHVLAAHLKKVHLAAREDDGRTQYVLVRGESGAQIDGAVAKVLAYNAAMTMPEAEPQVVSVFNDPDYSL